MLEQPADPIVRAVTARLDSNLDQIRELIDEFPAAKLWVRPTPSVVSLGNIVCHVAGSMMDWFRNGAGQEGWVRNRQREFDCDEELPPEELQAMLDDAREICNPMLLNVTADNWSETRTFRGKSFSLGEILLAQVSHVAYHAGQGAFLRVWVAGLKPRP